jgi:hypothetical protein
LAHRSLRIQDGQLHGCFVELSLWPGSWALLNGREIASKAANSLRETFFSAQVSRAARRFRMCLWVLL